MTSLEGPDAALHRDVLAISEAATIADLGNADWSMTTSDLISFLTPSPHTANSLAVAVQNGTTVGYATASLPLSDNLSAAEINAYVHPDYRNRGIGGELFDWAEHQATDQGRSVLQPWVNTPEPQPGEPVAQAPTGGELPADFNGVKFLLGHGYALEQVERASRQDLPVDPAVLEPLRRDAVAHSDGYLMHTWRTPLPEQWVSDFARLRSRVSIEAPIAGLDYEEEVWDADRLHERWSESARIGCRAVVVAAEHLATHRLVAFSEMLWNAERREFAWQGYTFVSSDHRGHRLGTLVKITMLDGLPSVAPETTRIYTSNATENAPMLSINVAMGYRPCGAYGCFQKKVVPTTI